MGYAALRMVMFEMSCAVRILYTLFSYGSNEPRAHRFVGGSADIGYNIRTQAAHRGRQTHIFLLRVAMRPIFVCQNP